MVKKTDGAVFGQKDQRSRIQGPAEISTRFRLDLADQLLAPHPHGKP